MWLGSKIYRVPTVGGLQWDESVRINQVIQKANGHISGVSSRRQAKVGYRSSLAPPFLVCTCQTVDCGRETGCRYPENTQLVRFLDCSAAVVQ
jgi:hypothetical protein